MNGQELTYTGTPVLIAAMDKNRLIGAGGQLPWHAPEDLRFFKKQTLHRTVVMGRKTFESIGRALPNRQNVVVSRRKGFEAPGCIVTHTLEDALRIHDTQNLPPMVIGGSSLYHATIGSAAELILTRVAGEYTGDTYFPEFESLDRYEMASEVACAADERLRFQRWVKKT